jgi:hypothetical protein
MGWEQRGNHSYYYRKQRIGARVRSVYVGRGRIADMTAALDAVQQRDLERERRKEQQEQHTSQVLDASIDASIELLAKLVSTLTEAVLVAHGFHQHKRQWRKKRA